MSEMHETAKALVAEGKGILAADESTGSIKKKLEKASIEDSVQNHRKYRQLFFTTPEIEKYISGVIMYDETIRQKDDSGKPFTQLLSEKGILPGIKVDEGKREIPGFDEETVTIGLDRLPGRLEEYKQMGAKFTKWRGVINIDSDSPSDVNIHSNAEVLARYAALVQSKDMTPIVEPEILMDGDHDISKSREVAYSVLNTVFEELSAHKVDFSGMLLKPSMVHEGKGSSKKSTPKEIAEATLAVLKEVVPHEVPGIVFLSGGMSSAEAEENLREINRLGDLPWELSFSFGRALQNEALKIWAGKDENIEAAQKAFIETAKRDSMAAKGK